MGEKHSEKKKNIWEAISIFDLTYAMANIMTLNTRMMIGRYIVEYGTEEEDGSVGSRAYREREEGEERGIFMISNRRYIYKERERDCVCVRQRE